MNHTTSQPWSDRFVSWGAACTTGLALSLPLSNSGTSIFGLLLLLLWIVSGQILKIPKQIKANPITLIALVLFALLIARIPYSPAATIDAIGVVKKYRELLLIAALIPFLIDQRSRRWTENGFWFGLVVLLGISLAMGLGHLESLRFHNQPDPSPISRIPHNTFMAFGTFWAAHKIMDLPKQRVFWAIALVLATFNIFFMVGGRTGQLLFLCLTLLFFYQRLSLKKMAAGILVLALLLAGAYLFSDTFSGRINEISSNIQTYQEGDSRTGVGYRLEFMKNSLRLWSQAPLIGHGTGSFPLEYALLANQLGVPATVNPHNEYLLIAVQTGIIGSGLFLGLLLMQLYYSRRLPAPWDKLAQGLAVTMGVGCLLNSFLLDSLEGHFFALLTALCFAPLGLTRSPDAPPKVQAHS